MSSSAWQAVRSAWQAVRSAVVYCEIHACIVRMSQSPIVYAVRARRPETYSNPRMLVVHRTGSGKTATMIQIANNYFLDRRPKVLIFPTAAVCANVITGLEIRDEPRTAMVASGDHPSLP